MNKNNYEYIGVIELDDGYYDVVKVTTKEGVYLEAGNSFNTGFMSFYGVDFNDNLDQALSELYERIMEDIQDKRDLNELLRDY